MDTGRLRSTVESLLEEESRLGLEGQVQSVLTTLSSLISNPADPNHQMQVKDALDQLGRAFAELRMGGDPTFADYAKKIGAEPFFSRALLNRVTTAIAENSMTPAVAQQDMQALHQQRQAYVGQLRNLQTSMGQLGIEGDEVERGQSQIGFRIPREIFSNELPGWIDELNELRRIIRPFSELATGGAETAEIGEISSTDPIIFLILKPVTVALVAKAVSWSIDQWKKVEEIRKLRADTAKISSSMNGALDGISAQYEAMIERLVQEAVTEHSRALVNPPEEAGRPHELVAELAISLSSLLGRIERGMKIELKFLPNELDGNEEDEDAVAMGELGAILPQLNFPTASAVPIIALPRREGETPQA